MLYFSMLVYYFCIGFKHIHNQKSLFQANQCLVRTYSVGVTKVIQPVLDLLATLPGQAAGRHFLEVRAARYLSY